MPSLSITPERPYSLERTVGAFARFADEQVDIVVPGGYRRLFDIGGDLALVHASQSKGDDRDGTVEIRPLDASHPPAHACEHALQQMRHIIAVDEPIGALNDVLCGDATLKHLLPHLVGLRRTLDPSPFEGLVSSILAQLISIRGAATVRARLVTRFGRSILHDDREYWTFPGPEGISESTVDELCNLKMTSAKARSILTVAQATLAGELEPDQLRRHTDEELTRHLTALPGIGPWTAEWFLVNVMGRMSVVPAGDLGIRRSTGNWFLGGEMPSPRQVREIYGPHGELRAYVAYYVLSAERYSVPFSA